MIFRFIYQPSEFSRIIPAINIEARASIPTIKNQIGSVIKSYNDTEVDKIQDDVLFYKIETTDGVLVGYFSLKIKVVVSPHVLLLQFQTRPSFSNFVTQISAQITNFINNGYWNQDYLL